VYICARSANCRYKASVVCMMAGSDFIKTSTGKEVENATLPVSLVMCRAIREFLLRTDGYKVGFKPAGGIAAAKQALAFQALMKEVRGRAGACIRACVARAACTRVRMRACMPAMGDVRALRGG
jgi:deoxyribose-phosphate aldolase